MAKFLANENVPGDAIEAARGQGYDVQWIGELDPGATDEEVLRRALADSRVLVTFDKDFGKLVFRGGKRVSCGVILLRPRLRSLDYVVQFVLDVLAGQAPFEGHFTVAQEGKLRILPLPG
jgi:predicted nuclease of predicted toxin-antitoxin system